MKGSKGAAEDPWGLWLECLRRWAAIQGEEVAGGRLSCVLERFEFEVLPFDGDVGGPWVPWWGLCVAARQHKGIGHLGVGTTET